MALPLPPAPGVNVTPIETSVPPDAEVGCSVIEPLQLTPPKEQLVFKTDTVKTAGAVSDVSLMLKKVPLVWIVNGPEPATATCTFITVPDKATLLGVALNCDSAIAITGPPVRQAAAISVRRIAVILVTRL